MSPNGSSSPLMSSNAVVGAEWSPDGRAIAVSTQASPPGGGSLASYSVATGAKTTWIASAQEWIVPMGWWSRWGIGYTTVDGGGVPGGSASADGSPFLAIAAPGGRPRPIGRTLMDMRAGGPAVAPNGALAFVSSGTGGREIGEGKAVETCDLDGGCAEISGASTWTGANPQPCPVIIDCGPDPAPGSAGSGVTLDPAWSPDGRMLAVVKAPYSWRAWPSLAWFASARLELFDPRRDTVTSVPGAGGAIAPMWSRNGRALLYVSDDGLWVAGPSGSRPVEVERPLYPPADWSEVATAMSLAYYGQIDWTGQFSWWSP